MTAARHRDLLELAPRAGFGESQVAFVTAFQDRNEPAFKKAIAHLAWGTYAWCLTEPDHLIALDGAVAGGIRWLSSFDGR